MKRVNSAILSSLQHSLGICRGLVPRGKNSQLAEHMVDMEPVCTEGN